MMQARAEELLSAGRSLIASQRVRMAPGLRCNDRIRAQFTAAAESVPTAYIAGGTAESMAAFCNSLLQQQEPAFVPSAPLALPLLLIAGDALRGRIKWASVEEICERKRMPYVQASACRRALILQHPDCDFSSLRELREWMQALQPAALASTTMQYSVNAVELEGPFVQGLDVVCLPPAGSTYPWVALSAQLQSSASAHAVWVSVSDDPVGALSVPLNMQMPVPIVAAVPAGSSVSVADAVLLHEPETAIVFTYLEPVLNSCGTVELGSSAAQVQTALKEAAAGPLVSLLRRLLQCLELGYLDSLHSGNPLAAALPYTRLGVASAEYEGVVSELNPNAVVQESHRIVREALQRVDGLLAVKMMGEAVGMAGGSELLQAYAWVRMRVGMQMFLRTTLNSALCGALIRFDGSVQRAEAVRACLRDHVEARVTAANAKLHGLAYDMGVLRVL